MFKTLMFDVISLITIINPIAAAALMLSLVTYSEIKPTAKKASLTLLIASVITLYTGGLILKFFGINIPSIKAIGGLVLLGIAIHMLQGKESPTKTSKEEHEAAQEKEEVGVIPLGIPILFGPGLITTIIVLAEKHNDIYHKQILLAAIGISVLITYITLVNGAKISKFLGVNGLKITTRIMGLIIGAIAFMFLVDGIHKLWIGVV